MRQNVAYKSHLQNRHGCRRKPFGELRSDHDSHLRSPVWSRKDELRAFPFDAETQHCRTLRLHEFRPEHEALNRGTFGPKASSRDFEDVDAWRQFIA